VGIDHAFSFPLAYFEKYRLHSDWQDFLEDFHHHWPTDAPHTYVCFVRDDPSGRGLKRTGERNWLRLAEQWTPAAKSVFGFGVNGGCHFNPRWSALAPLPSQTMQTPNSLLAV
jgi:hypothetical protein